MNFESNFESGVVAPAKIKVIGVGGGGGNAVQNMIDAGLPGITFVCANTDAQALSKSKATIRLQIGDKLTKGLGAGADPNKGRDAALESIGAIKEAIGDADMVFVTAGMGGGTGTGAAPVVAQAAKEMGILTVGIVTKPFRFEGPKRAKAAEQGILELREHVDSIITIPNERLRTIAPKNAKYHDMFKKADDVLYSAVRGISDLIILPGHMNVDFADVRTVMSVSGLAMMGSGSASGEGRAIEAARRAITSPLLEDVSIAGAKAVLINISATSDLGMEEFSDAADYIHEALGTDVDSNIIIGTAFDENAGDEVRITVIATGIEEAMAINPVMPVGQTANITNFKTPNRAYVQPLPGLAIEPPVTKARTSRPVPAEVDLHKPTFMRNQKERAHTPGKEDFIFDEEEFELPSFIRRQAN